MSEFVLVDTDILIDMSRNIDEAITYIYQLNQHATVRISAITEMELVVGCRNKNELRELKPFLSHFQILKLNENISEIALKLLSTYRLSHGLLIPDALIAATAISHTIPLASKNQRDYRFISELNLLPYPA